MRAITLTALVLLLGACGSDDDCTASDATEQSVVTLMGNKFSPSCVKVAAGSPVTFTNRDMTAHTIITMPNQPVTFDSMALGKDASYAFTFSAPGTVKVQSKNAPDARATIIVQ